jgi:small-conductance mechanosensitive channel
MDILESTFLGNTIQSWLIAAGVTFGVFIAIRYVAIGVAKRISRTASRTENHWDDVFARALDGTKSFLLLFVAIFIGTRFLDISDRWSNVAQSAAIIGLLVQAGVWLSNGLTEWLAERSRVRAAEDPAEVMTLNILGVTAKIGLWSMVLLLSLDNLGIDVTALVAGLGIGGVAVALAAQNILGDLFASLSIVLDKPFVLGDFVTVGDFLGSVEAIGLKTTRLRSLSGEQVIFSNADLLTSRIRNFGRMYERRVVLKTGVTYQTPRSDLAAIPGILREAVESHGDRVRFDRSHLSSYGDFAIVFETVYFVLSPEFAVHMDIQQDILLRTHEAFEERDIEFAYPTQTLFLEGLEGGRSTRPSEEQPAEAGSPA